MEFTIQQIKNYLNKQDSFGDAVYNLNEKNVLDANMPDLHICSSCGKESDDDKDFETDLGSVDKDEMTCETCYDEMNENM